jgi:hypothetical protein
MHIFQIGWFKIKEKKLFWIVFLSNNVFKLMQKFMT